jgi:sulfite reductase (NADPH) flavoprotein alpha-component
MTEIPVIPENAPFQPEQRLWLNGFLAGYFSRRSVPDLASAAVASERISLLILFGSQTGTAEGLAKRLSKLAATRGFDARVRDAADHAQIDWRLQRTLLVVTSTYGDGEMPDNAQSFWEWLQTENAPPMLAHLQFAVLALGDRSYADFCGAGKKIDRQLEALGARRFFNRVDCDLDYETEAKAWMDGALRAAQQLGADPGPTGPATEPFANLPVTSANGSSHAHASAAPSEETYSKLNPFPAVCLKNLCLNKPGSGKEVRHFELDLGGSRLTYEPGDALGVVPRNCPALVEEFLRVQGASGEEVIRVDQSEVPLREALSSRMDITKPSNQLLAEVGRLSPASELARLLAPDRAAELKRWLWGRDVVDILSLLAAPVPVDQLPTLLRKLAPRFYSISSSPRAHPGQVHLTVSALRYQSHGRQRKGVASTYLADRLPANRAVKLFVQPSRGFKLPADGAVPIIMVGPGTGIAPFRAFLEERQTSGARGKNWLFFGEQKRAVDFLYEDQLLNWRKEGHLTRFDAAFSRDQVEKIYVQHLMLEHSGQVWGWLQEGAYFYVCGDASRMAKDVDAALHTIAERAGGLTSDGAREFVNRLKTEKRYQRDVY